MVEKVIMLKLNYLIYINPHILYARDNINEVSQVMFHKAIKILKDSPNKEAGTELKYPLLKPNSISYSIDEK